MKETQTTHAHELLTEKEAAEYLRISRMTLYLKRRDGEITYRRAGGKLLYHRDEDLNSYIARSKRGGFAIAA